LPDPEVALPVEEPAVEGLPVVPFPVEGFPVVPLPVVGDFPVVEEGCLVVEDFPVEEVLGFPVDPAVYGRGNDALVAIPQLLS